MITASNNCKFYIKSPGSLDHQKYTRRDREEHKKKKSQKFLQWANQNLSCRKKHENKEGYIQQSFFEFENIKKSKFISGPFTNLVFNLISENNKMLNVQIDKFCIWNLTKK